MNVLELDQLVRNAVANVARFVIHETSVKFPYTAASALDPMIVPVNPVQSILFTKALDVIITSPEPLLASKYTFSHIGTLAPLAHHELVDQFVVESQYPFPPGTQYLFTDGFPAHPIFPDTNVLFAHSFHIAPHVTPMSLIER